MRQCLSQAKQILCKYRCQILYVLLFLLVTVPVFTTSVQVNGNQPPWAMLPGFLGGLVQSSVAGTKTLIFLVQSATFATSYFLFRKVFSTVSGAFFGTLLYTTWPYQEYLMFDKMDLGGMISFMMLPLFVRCMISVYTIEKKKMWVPALLAGLSLAGIAYSDWVVALICADVVIVSLLWYKKWQGLLPLAVGGILYLPGARYLVYYILFGGMEGWNLNLGSIMPKGYQLGRFFTSFVYKEGLPGMGLPLLCALILLGGLAFVKENFKWNKAYNFPLFLALALAILSLSAFPWDYVQRLGMPFVRAVGLLESPAVFWGCAGIPLSVLGAYGIESFVEKYKKKEENVCEE